MTQYTLQPNPGYGDLSITVGWDAQRGTYYANVAENLSSTERFTYLQLGLGEQITDAQTVVNGISYFAVIPDDLLNNLVNDRLDTLPLADLIDQAPTDQPPAWLPAHRRTVDVLGRSLARRIHWTDPDHRWTVTGTLTGADRTITVQFLPDHEPGTSSLWAQAQCPDEPTCPGPAWTQLAHRREYLIARREL